MKGISVKTWSRETESTLLEMLISCRPHDICKTSDFFQSCCIIDAYALMKRVNRAFRSVTLIRLINNILFLNFYWEIEQFSYRTKNCCTLLRELDHRLPWNNHTLFKLINCSFFHSFFHSFMYRVYIEGNYHSKNGKEWYKEITTNILIYQLS